MGITECVVCAKFVAERGSAAEWLASADRRTLKIVESTARDFADLRKRGGIDEHRAQDEVACLQWARVANGTAWPAMLPQCLEQHPVHRALHETRLDVDELAGVLAADDQPFHQLVEQGDSLTLSGEFGLREHGILVQASRVEGL